MAYCHSSWAETAVNNYMISPPKETHSLTHEWWQPWHLWEVDTPECHQPHSYSCWKQWLGEPSSVSIQADRPSLPPVWHIWQPAGCRGWQHPPDWHWQVQDGWEIAVQNLGSSKVLWQRKAVFTFGTVKETSESLSTTGAELVTLKKLIIFCTSPLKPRSTILSASSIQKYLQLSKLIFLFSNMSIMHPGVATTMWIPLLVRTQFRKCGDLYTCWHNMNQSCPASHGESNVEGWVLVHKPQ